MVSVVILLPSVVKAEDFCVRVMEGSLELDQATQCLKPFVHLHNLQRNWIHSIGHDHMEEYHPQFLILDGCPKIFPNHNNHILESSEPGSFCFPVQTIIVKKLSLRWMETSCCVIYVDLRAHDDYYERSRNENSFETC